MEDEIIETYKCSDCWCYLEESGFHKNRATKSGLHNICRGCIKIRNGTISKINANIT